MRTISLVLSFVLLLLPNTLAQDPASVVEIRTVAPPEPLTAGKAAVITVELSIATPYHINSDQPLEDYLIPTTLEFEPYPGLKFGKATFPSPQLKKFTFSEAPMSVYEGTIRIAAEVLPDSSLAQKEIVVRGGVGYQACNDTTCLRPVKKAFSVKLSVAAVPPPPSVARETSPSVESPPAPPPPAAVPKQTRNASPAVSADFSDRGFPVMLVLVFLGGLALNLTPCVYPMIPITISYFGGQSQGKRGSIIAHSLLYVIGMAVTYSILGVVAAMTGGLFGAALQYPPVLVFIALVMILLALSMFDVYEFRMPAFLSRLAGGSQKGFLGTFLMGLTVGIVAAPCIGPFVLGLLTYVGNKGNAFLGFILFFVLAIGMGIPFMVLGAFSGSIKRLPRSGAWMVWVRKIFGFILLAMAAYFLEPLFPNPLTYHLTLALILLLAGIYLAWIDEVQGAGKGFAFLRNIVGILFFAMALYAATTGIDTHLKRLQAGFAGEVGSTIQWFPYSETMLSQAALMGKPVFIDFYADWCAPCKELDAKTFSTPEVIRRSKDFVMLKVDLTSTDDPQAEALRKKYQVKGVPTLVFLKPDGQEIPDLRGTGFETKEIFLGKMDRAHQMSAAR